MNLGDDFGDDRGLAVKPGGDFGGNSVWLWETGWGRAIGGTPHRFFQKILMTGPYHYTARTKKMYIGPFFSPAYVHFCPEYGILGLFFLFNLVPLLFLRPGGRVHLVLTKVQCALVPVRYALLQFHHLAIGQSALVGHCCCQDSPNRA